MAKTGSINFNGGPTGNMELIEHQSISTTASFTGLAGYHVFYLVVDISTSVNNESIKLKVNNYTGLTYYYSRISGSTLNTSTTQNHFRLNDAIASRKQRVTGGIYLSVDYDLSGGTECLIAADIAGERYTNDVLLKGHVTGLSGDVTQIDIFASSNLKGTATLYGVKA